ncbi:hypothetical protein C8Q74DRAFT_1222386 [Fomes fomentarius]|nr:hypothetical protein C8Q74DRAFT_1222386 [Fomes fomentarius]
MVDTAHDTAKYFRELSDTILNALRVSRFESVAFYFLNISRKSSHIHPRHSDTPRYDAQHDAIGQELELFLYRLGHYSRTTQVTLGPSMLGRLITLSITRLTVSADPSTQIHCAIDPTDCVCDWAIDPHYGPWGRLHPGLFDHSQISRLLAAASGDTFLQQGGGDPPPQSEPRSALLGDRSVVAFRVLHLHMAGQTLPESWPRYSLSIKQVFLELSIVLDSGCRATERTVFATMPENSYVMGFSTYTAEAWLD